LPPGSANDAAPTGRAALLNLTVDTVTMAVT